MISEAELHFSYAHCVPRDSCFRPRWKALASKAPVNRVQLEQARAQLAEIQRALDALKKLLHEPAKGAPAPGGSHK